MHIIPGNDLVQAQFTGTVPVLYPINCTFTVNQKLIEVTVLLFCDDFSDSTSMECPDRSRSFQEALFELVEIFWVLFC